MVAAGSRVLLLVVTLKTCEILPAQPRGAGSRLPLLPLAVLLVPVVGWLRDRVLCPCGFVPAPSSAPRRLVVRPGVWSLRGMEFAHVQDDADIIAICREVAEFARVEDGVVSCHVMSSHVMAWHTTPCPVMPCRVLLCCAFHKRTAQLVGSAPSHSD